MLCVNEKIEFGTVEFDVRNNNITPRYTRFHVRAVAAARGAYTLLIAFNLF
jgi:hypothetical protein